MTVLQSNEWTNRAAELNKYWHLHWHCFAPLACCCCNDGGGDQEATRQAVLLRGLAPPPPPCVFYVAIESGETRDRNNINKSNHKKSTTKITGHSGQQWQKRVKREKKSRERKTNKWIFTCFNICVCVCNTFFGNHSHNLIIHFSLLDFSLIDLNDGWWWWWLVLILHLGNFCRRDRRQRRQWEQSDPWAPVLLAPVAAERFFYYSSSCCSLSSLLSSLFRSSNQRSQIDRQTDRQKKKTKDDDALLSVWVVLEINWRLGAREKEIRFYYIVAAAHSLYFVFVRGRAANVVSRLFTIISQLMLCFRCSRSAGAAAAALELVQGEKVWSFLCAISWLIGFSIVFGLLSLSSSLLSSSSSCDFS